MANFTVRTNTRNIGGVGTHYSSQGGYWFVVFSKDGALQNLSIPRQASRSVREILAEDYNVDIADAEVEFLRG